MSRVEGQIVYEEYHDRIMVDAEPHVMARLRNIFDNSQNHWNQGKYTHKPITFPFNMTAAKDLLWLRHRYNLEIDQALLDKIQGKSDEYDRVTEAVMNADKDAIFKVSPDALPLALSLREHQVIFTNMFNQVHRMLLADKMGLGKTPAAISVLQEPHRRPALIVVPPHLCTQWEREIKRFLPGASTHVIRGFKNYELPVVDVLITSYNRLKPWQDVLLDTAKHKFRTLIGDEIHELRHMGTDKRELFAKLSERADFCLGLSGTPIFNHGAEIWSVLDSISPHCLGDNEDFSKEWCSWSGKVREPAVLHHYLKTRGLMLRRSPDECGMKFGEASKHVYTLDADIEKLKEIQDVAKMLAISVLSGRIGEDSDASREFDWKMRHATGVAKARPVAEFVKMLCDQGEKVLLAGWHRDVYDIWMKELKDYKPVMYTGSESVKQKDEAVKTFVEGDAQVFIISLRSGAGLDGLQRACNTFVCGELDWSPHVMDQILARVDRDGQTKHVQGFYLTIADGSDPFMININADKRSQHDGLVEGKAETSDILAYDQNARDRIRAMAENYLKSIGEEIPIAVPEVGLLADVAIALRQIRVNINDEEGMQRGVADALPKLLSADTKIEREVKISKRSRLDFLISRGDESVAIECKIESTKRAEVYRQVRRYAEEGIKSVVLYAPWHGIKSFLVDQTPVIVVDVGTQSL